jgi:hypothetical protein
MSVQYCCCDWESKDKSKDTSNDAPQLEAPNNLLVNQVPRDVDRTKPINEPVWSDDILRRGAAAVQDLHSHQLISTLAVCPFEIAMQSFTVDRR